MGIHTTRVFDKWFDRLKDKHAKSIIEGRIQRIANNDDFGDVRAISANVSEMRIDYGPGYRLYLTRRGTTVIILLIGGNKDTQARDIKKAEMLAKTEFKEAEK